MHSANSSWRLPSLAPDTLCKMPGVLHTQGIYFTHKEVLLVGRKERRPAVQQCCPVPVAGFYGQAAWKKKTESQEEVTSHTALRFYFHAVYMCVCLCAGIHVCVLHSHVTLNFPWRLNTRISSASWKKIWRFMCRGNSKSLAKEVCRWG